MKTILTITTVIILTFLLACAWFDWDSLSEQRREKVIEGPTLIFVDSTQVLIIEANGDTTKWEF